MENSRVKAVLFDMDDTLISWADAKQTWGEFMQPGILGVHKCLSSLGYQVGEEDLGRAFSLQMKYEWQHAQMSWRAPSLASIIDNTLNKLGIQVSGQEHDELIRAFDWNPVPGVAPYPDALAVLGELKARGYKIGLLTNAFQPMWMRDVELVEYGLIDFLDARVTSGDVGYIKPHPAIYKHLAELIGVSPLDCVFVGDHPAYDIKGAKLSGMTSVFIDPPHLGRVVGQDPAHFTISTLSELLPILDSLS